MSNKIIQVLPTSKWIKPVTTPYGDRLIRPRHNQQPYGLYEKQALFLIEKGYATRYGGMPSPPSEPPEEDPPLPKEDPPPPEPPEEEWKISAFVFLSTASAAEIEEIDHFGKSASGKIVARQQEASDFDELTVGLTPIQLSSLQSKFSQR